MSTRAPTAATQSATETSGLPLLEAGVLPSANRKSSAPHSLTSTAQQRLQRSKSSKEVRDTEGSGKPPRRPRNFALTWEVPPALHGGAAEPAGGAKPADLANLPSDGGRAAIHPLVVLHRSAFQDAADAHLHAIVRQLLGAEEPTVAEKWEDAVVSLAQEAANALSPSALAAFGVNDPRFYVKVKCIPFNSIGGDSCLVDGLVCRKNVAHRRMRTHIERPRILMLRGALENRRASTNLSSFDTMLDQEQAQLRKAVDRIASFEPDILLVEKSAARFTQDALLEKGIALVLNVKGSLLDRLARCSGAQVADSVEDLNPKCVAQCQEFSVEALQTSQNGMTRAVSNSALSALALSDGEGGEAAAPRREVSESAAARKGGVSNGARTLMTFRGCTQRMGSTILLKGDSPQQLARIKSVVQFAVYAAYRQRLETALLADQTAAECAAAASLEPAPGSPEDSQPASPFQAAAEQAGAAAQALPPSPPLQQQEPQEDGADTAAAPASPGGSRAHASASSDPQHSRSVQATQAIVQASAQLAARDRGGRSILSCSPHVSCWPATATDQPELDASQPAASAVVMAARQSTAATQQPAAEADAGSEDGSSMAASAGAPASAPSSPRPSAAVQRMAEAQRLFMSTACRNPTKKLLCESPTVQVIRTYESGDKPLAAFLAGAFPAPERKCVQPNCGDGAMHHLRTFVHSGQRVTLSVAQLPASQELPGGDRGQMWIWARPLPAGDLPCPGIRRVALSADAVCISFGHFLELSFAVQHLEVHGWHAHNEWVRYIGRGSCVACFHCEPVSPNTVALPPPRIDYSPLLQQDWLRQELQELAKEAQSAFGAIEYALQSHRPAEAASGKGAQLSKPPAKEDEKAILQSLLDGLNSEQQVYNNDLMDIATLLRLNSGVSNDGSPSSGQSPADIAPVREHVLVAIVWELNRLRHSLMLTVLAWAASLHDPAIYARSYSGPPSTTSKSSISALIADSAAANVAAEKASAGEATGAASGGTPQQELSAASPPKPIRGRPPATGIATSPSSAPHEMLTPTVGYNARQADKDSASAYAVTALADAAVLHANGTAGSAEQQQAPDVQDSGVAEAVDWQKVAEQADSYPASAALQPAGSVARLRAIFEQQTGDAMPKESHTLQRQRTLEWLSAMSKPSVSGTPDRRRQSADTALLMQHENGPWGPVVRRRRPSFFGRSYPHLGEGAHASGPGVQTGAADAPTQARSAGSSGAAPEQPVDESSDSGADSSNDSSRRPSGHAIVRPLLHRGGSTITLDLVNGRAEQTGVQQQQQPGREPAGQDEAERGVQAAASTEAVPPTADMRRISSAAALNDAEPAADAADTSAEEETALLPYSPAASPSKAKPHRRCSSEPSSPRASPTANGIHHDELGSGELPHFEEWSTFVKAAAAGSPVKEPLLGDVDKSQESSPRQSKGSPAQSTTDSVLPAPSKVDSLLPAIGRLSGKRGGAAPATAAAGTIPLAAAGRVELCGRALLPPGVDDLVLSIFDDEPTSIIAYFLTTRTYQQYIEDALNTILHGKPAGGSDAALKRAFSSSSETASFLDAATAAAAAAAEAPAAAISAANAASSAPGSAAPLATDPPAAPMRSSSAAPSASATAADAPAKADVPPAAPGNNVAGSSAAVPRQHVASDGSAADKSATDKADLPSTADIAAEVYGLHIGGESGSSTADRQPAGGSTGSGGGASAAAGLADEIGDRVLLCEERLDFLCTVEESPGMPWARAKFQVVAYFAPQFAELRRRSVGGGEAAFVASLSRCRKWDSSGGKSNAYFAKSRDERYIVKQLSRSEKASLLGTAPAYFKYLLERGRDTCLAKILGVYQVTQKNMGGDKDGAKGAGRDGIMDLLVMENIFYGRATSRIYDLKGSERSRLSTEDPARAGAVLMDENLRRSNLSAPLLIDPVAYARLEEALWADTAFLAALGVMDYSLLVGIDRDASQLVVGIIDFVRQYTWDKQLETWVKSTGILAGGKEPTVISPKQYLRRFRAAMASYFTLVPGCEPPAPRRSPDA